MMRRLDAEDIVKAGDVYTHAYWGNPVPQPQRDNINTVHNDWLGKTVGAVDNIYQGRYVLNIYTETKEPVKYISKVKPLPLP